MALFKKISLYVLPATVSMCTVCMPRAHPVQRGHLIPGVMDGCGVPCGCWKLTLEPLQEQEVILMADPLVQSPLCIFIHFLFTLFSQSPLPLLESLSFPVFTAV